jgi:hypothetical protein
MRNAYKDLIKILEGMRPLRRAMRSGVENIKMDLG